MRARAVDHLTRARARTARWTPLERRAAAALAIAWLAGASLEALGWHLAPGGWAASRLGGELPTATELAARLPAGDPRPAWYAAGLALREERRRAEAGPMRIDPNAADRADWDRLPGVGPRIAEAILAVREERGGFREAEDLLEVRGIGPATLERLRPWLSFEADAGAAETLLEADRAAARTAAPRAKPDLNRVDAAFLDSLPGFGPHLASLILRERGRRGGFRDWADVRTIEGVGSSRLAILQNATRIPNVRPDARLTKSEER